MANAKPPRTFRPWKYGLTSLKKRSDGLYYLDACVTWADLGLVSADEAFIAVTKFAPYRNPLKWATIAVSDGKEPLVALSQLIKSTGSLSLALDSLDIPLSLIGLKDRGVSGTATVHSGSTELTHSLEMMAV